MKLGSVPYANRGVPKYARPDPVPAQTLVFERDAPTPPTRIEVGIHALRSEWATQIPLLQDLTIVFDLPRPRSNASGGGTLSDGSVLGRIDELVPEGGDFALQGAGS